MAGLLSGSPQRELLRESQAAWKVSMWLEDRGGAHTACSASRGTGDRQQNMWSSRRPKSEILLSKVRYIGGSKVWGDLSKPLSSIVILAKCNTL